MSNPPILVNLEVEVRIEDAGVNVEEVTEDVGVNLKEIIEDAVGMTEVEVAMNAALIVVVVDPTREPNSVAAVVMREADSVAVVIMKEADSVAEVVMSTVMTVVGVVMREVVVGMVNGVVVEVVGLLYHKKIRHLR